MTILAKFKNSTSSKANDEFTLPADKTQIDYIECANIAIDFIVRNLDGDLTLDKISAVAGFSPFHFHRVFRSIVGETLKQFIKRVRLERALYLMSHSPSRSLTQVALECGFSSSSDFSRSFKNRYGCSPSSFDVQKFRDSRRDEFQSIMANFENGPDLPRNPAGENPDNFAVIMREFPARTVAYIRVLNPFGSTGVVDASRLLVEWAERQGVADGAWLGYMWEDPEIVALKDCRYDVAVVIDEDQFEFRPDGEIGRYEFPPMLVADVEIRGDIQTEQRAIDWLYGTWLPQSGFVPVDQPAFESWNGRPFAHGFEYFELSMQLPVKKG